MTEFYYFLVLVNAAVCTLVAIVAYRKNYREMVGALIGGAMLLMALWLFGFAQYFRPLDPATAIGWGKVTLSLGVINTPVFFHGVCALMKRQRNYRWLIAGTYLTGLMCIGLVWQDQIIAGLKYPPYMDHYLRYNRSWYPFLIGHIVVWQWLTAGLLVYRAWRETGYMRTQLSYFAAAWFVIFLPTNSIIIPMEYDINIQPFGFFIMPLNLILIGYVMSQARLADFNVVIARGLLYTVTLVAVALLCLLFVGAVTMLSPGFMGPPQTLFTVAMVLVIGLVLAISLPQFLPQAERMVQSRLFGERMGYQEKLSGLTKELSALPTVDQTLNAVVQALQTHMQLSRVLVLIEDPLSGLFKLEAEHGLRADETTDGFNLREDAAIVRHLAQRQDALVRDELPRLVKPEQQRALEAELDRLRVTVCVPMTLDNKLMGLIGLGGKVNQEMFYVSDLRLLGNLATEVGLAIKYRRMEDQVVRKNRLVELGTIAAGVAHEIRNPLASIRTFAQLLPERSNDVEFQTEFSKLVLKDVDRVSNVIESMLAFSRPAQVTIGQHAAVELVEEALLLAQPRLKSGRIEVVREFHEQPVLRVDRQQILQILLNLVNNALDVLPEHGRLRVAVGTRVMENATDGTATQKYGVIEVADNGPGIPAAVRNRVFDPFFTTKREGTGLGLSISQKIARDHGGIITCSSIEGKGASFQINLPLT
jgi:signal transduction histidine kinase